MLVLNKGKKSEVAVRVFLESEYFGREYFDSYDSLRECAAAVAKLARSCVKESEADGVGRQVGIAVVPKSKYGDVEDYGYDD